MLYVEIGTLFVLIVINGLLAMSELAIVSARPARLKAMIDRNVRGARRALDLSANPGRFLSTVQTGITLVAVISGAFSGATLGERFAAWLYENGMPYRTANAVGVGAVVALITYFSLIAGELVPKQLALRSPEAIAVKAAPFMAALAKVAAPLVWFLDISGRGLLWLLGQREESEERVTDEEIKMLVAEAEHHGTIESDERRMIAGVMRLGDRAVRAVMTPRTDVDWINLEAEPAAIRKMLLESPHSRLPAGEGSVDAMIGVVQTRDVLAAALEGKALDARPHVRTAPIVHDQADALDVLNETFAGHVEDLEEGRAMRTARLDGAGQIDDLVLVARTGHMDHTCSLPASPPIGQPGRSCAVQFIAGAPSTDPPPTVHSSPSSSGLR